MNLHLLKTLMVSFLISVVVSGCFKGKNPLENGLTEEIKMMLIDKTFEELEISENFNPQNFEAQQLKHYGNLTAEMKQAAMDNLPNRIKEITDIQMSQSVEIQKSSATVELKFSSEKTIASDVEIVANRSYKTSNGSKTVLTQYILPWTITANGDVLVFQHSGFRIKSVE